MTSLKQEAARAIRGTRRAPMGMGRPFVVFLAAALFVGGCAAGGGSPETEPAVPGCYRFQEAEGDSALGLPWGIQLTDEPLEAWPALTDAFVARTWLTPDRSADHPFGYWRHADGDSIRTGYPAGGGFDLTLALPDETGEMAGWGRAVGDALAPNALADPPPPRPVTARRVSCPSP